MSVLPPPRSRTLPIGQGQGQGQNLGQGANQTYRPLAVAPMTGLPRESQAPTLLQYFRSDSRDVPGRRRPRWAGAIAFWVGLLAAGTLFVGGTLLGIVGAAGAALAFAAVAAFFGLLGFIAGIGRGLAVVGLILALLGVPVVVAWLAALFA